MEVVLGQMTFLEKVVSSLPSERLISLSSVMAFSVMAFLVMASLVNLSLDPLTVELCC